MENGHSQTQNDADRDVKQFSSAVARQGLPSGQGNMLATGNKARQLHALVVSHHWNTKNNLTFMAVWADRQIEALRKLGVKVSTFDIGTSHSPIPLAQSWIRLRRTVRQLKPDVVHARYGTRVGLLSAWSGAPAVITYAGSDLLPGAGISTMRTWFGITLSNLAALKVRRIICVSEGLRRALWWRGAAALVIPDGVDLELFKPQPRDEARRKLGWRLEDHVVLMDALRDPIGKGLALGQEAIRLVQKRIPGARLELLCRVKPTDMPLYCSAADVLLLASRSEGSPNTVKEAMACNLPVVSVDVGDVQERLTKVVPSRIVPRRPEAMADGLCEILQLRQRSNGREHVLELSLDRVAERVLAVYKSVLPPGKPTT